MPTIVDVARMAGVSPTTVSRVLNGIMIVSKDTERRVWQAVDALGYRPNASARALITRRTSAIGIVVGDICDPFFPPIIHGITRVANEHGLSSFLCNLSVEAELALYFKLVDEKRVDGVIVTTSKLPPEQIEVLNSGGLPLVLVNRRMEGLPWVCTDYEAAGREATLHLIKQGYYRIAHITAPSFVQTAVERRVGYEQALREAGYPLRSEYISVAENSLEGGLQAASSLLALPERPDAVFVYDDVMAIGAMCAFQKNALRIPSQMGIIGCDDIAMVNYVVPSLSTMRVEKETMGDLGMNLLASLIGGQKLEKSEILLPATLVERESSIRRPATT